VLDDRIEKRRATSLFDKRPRFLLNVVGDQIGSSIPRPMEPTTSTLQSISSISGRSLRIV